MTLAKKIQVRVAVGVNNHRERCLGCGFSYFRQETNLMASFLILDTNILLGRADKIRVEASVFNEYDIFFCTACINYVCTYVFYIVHTFLRKKYKT